MTDAPRNYMPFDRCGWEQAIRDCDSYLANIVVAAVEERARHDCRPRTGY